MHMMKHIMKDANFYASKPFCKASTKGEIFYNAPCILGSSLSTLISTLKLNLQSSLTSSLMIESS